MCATASHILTVLNRIRWDTSKKELEFEEWEQIRKCVGASDYIIHVHVYLIDDVTRTCTLP
jgi:hypothetical protein